MAQKPFSGVAFWSAILGIEVKWFVCDSELTPTDVIHDAESRLESWLRLQVATQLVRSQRIHVALARRV
jgi:hypothetical protein